MQQTMRDATEQNDSKNLHVASEGTPKFDVDQKLSIGIDGRIVSASPPACQLLGYSLPEMLNKRLDDVLTVGGECDFNTILNTLNEDGLVWRRLQFQGKKGRAIEAEVVAQLIEHNGSRLICLTVRNVDNRLPNQELKQITDSVPAFIAFVSAEQKYEFVNAFYESHYGIPREDICGLTVSQLNTSEAYRQCQPYIEAALRGQDVQFEFMSQCNRRRHYVIKYVPKIIHGKVLGYYVVSTDISDIKKAEDNLVESEQKLRIAYEQIQDLTVLAHQDRLTSMGELASAISHELNQPLMVISGMAHILESMVSEPQIDQERVKELTQTIANQTIQAGEIAHRMRRFVSKNHQNREKCSLNSIAEEAMDLTRSWLKNDKIKMVGELTDGPDGVWVDPLQIQQVIVNLIRNAAEAMAGQQEPLPVIRLVTKSNESNKIRLSIQDTGPGIAATQKSRLFEAFESTKNDGMGMGLVISRSLIESHYGELILDDDYVAGASFTISLEKTN